MTNATKRGESRETVREERVPIGGSRDILTVHGKDPNYVYRFVKDVGNRVKRFEKAGYIVETDENIIVGDARAAVGQSLGAAVTAMGDRFGERLVLMKILKEYYDEDQAAKMAQIDAVEAGMGRNVEGSYGDIKISR